VTAAKYPLPLFQSEQTRQLALAESIRRKQAYWALQGHDERRSPSANSASGTLH